MLCFDSFQQHLHVLLHVHTEQPQMHSPNIHASLSLVCLTAAGNRSCYKDTATSPAQGRFHVSSSSTKQDQQQVLTTAAATPMPWMKACSSISRAYRSSVTARLWKSCCLDYMMWSCRWGPGGRLLIYVFGGDALLFAA